ncbi:MAG: ArdC-like ssDNA-binding domain-containing protein [Acidimicrobiales bacterium]
MARDYAELLESLSEGITSLTTSERWSQYLEVQSRFPRYSSNNVLLILAQKPDATRVAGYRAWQALGHQVLEGESALRIFAPLRYRRDEEIEGDVAHEIRGFRLVPVFDVSQTTGPELPDIVNKLHGEAPSGVFARLVEFAEGLGFRVERPESLASGANGDTDFSTVLIRVASRNGEIQQVKTLAHEIAHALLHDPELPANREILRPQQELEAESVAYVVCRALAIESGEYSFGYVVGWSGGGDEAIKGIKASTTRIQRAASAVVASFETTEPVVEAVNVVSAGVSVEQWRDRDVALDVGERWRADVGELARLYEISEARERKRTGSVRPVRSALAHLPTISTDFVERDASTTPSFELEI